VQCRSLPITELQEWLRSKGLEQNLGDSGPADDDLTVGRAVVKDFANARDRVWKPGTA